MPNITILSKYSRSFSKTTEEPSKHAKVEYMEELKKEIQKLYQHAQKLEKQIIKQKSLIRDEETAVFQKQRSVREELAKRVEIDERNRLLQLELDKRNSFN